MNDFAKVWEKIDAEHADIMVALNRARVIAAESALSAAALVPVYEAVVRKFEGHFASEERALAETRCPDADSHRRQHQVLLIRLLSICQQMRGGQSIEIEQLQLIFQSLLDDAIGADASFRDYLTSATA